MHPAFRNAFNALSGNPGEFLAVRRVRIPFHALTGVPGVRNSVNDFKD
jgi:hypothetical protein